MISGYLIGDKELIARFGRMPEAVVQGIARTVDMLGISLARLVVQGYLSGPRPGHLGRVTGRLASSIARGGADTRSRFEQSGAVATAYVGTNVPYGKIWELTGIPAHDIVPIKAKALRFTIGGQVLFRKRVHIPALAPRPFLAPALAEMKPQIIDELGKAATQAAQAALKS